MIGVVYGLAGRLLYYYLNATLKHVINIKNFLHALSDNPYRPGKGLPVIFNHADAQDVIDTGSQATRAPPDLGVLFYAYSKNTGNIVS